MVPRFIFDFAIPVLPIPIAIGTANPGIISTYANSGFLFLKRSFKKNKTLGGFCKSVLNEILKNLNLFED